MSTASSSKISSAGGQSSPGRFRGIFWNESGLRSGWRVLIYLVLFVALIFSLATATEYFVKPGSGILADGLFELMGFAGAMGAARIMSQIEKRPMSTYGLPARSAFKGLFWQGWLAGLIEVSIVVGFIAASDGYSFGTLAEGGGAALLYGLSWVIVSVAMSLFEEFTFRGYTQRTLAEGIGYWSAAEVLSGIFALAHLHDPVEGWVGAFVLLLVGVFWCLTLRRTGNLWFAVGMHASFKFGDTFLYSVPNIGPGFPTPGHLSNATLHGPPWLTGGAMGPEASAFRFVTIAILFLVFTRLYPPKNTLDKLELIQPRGTERIASRGDRPTLIPSG
jgi:membrane protease YdiL (CAAX protease family)